MKPRLFVAVLACLAGGACASVPAATDGPLPYVALSPPPQEGETRILLTAGLQSTLRIDAACVLMGNPQAGYSLPVFQDGAVTVGRDARGLYLRDNESGQTFRDGDRVQGGGGEGPRDRALLEDFLGQRVADTCWDRADGRYGSVNPGLRRR